VGNGSKMWRYNDIEIYCMNNSVSNNAGQEIQTDFLLSNTLSHYYCMFNIENIDWIEGILQVHTSLIR